MKTELALWPWLIFGSTFSSRKRWKRNHLATYRLSIKEKVEVDAALLMTLRLLVERAPILLPPFGEAKGGMDFSPQSWTQSETLLGDDRIVSFTWCEST